MLVRDLMQKDVVTATPETPITAVAQLMRRNDVGAIVILEADKLVGIVTDRDLVIQHLARGHTGDCPVREAMLGDKPLLGLVTIRPDMQLEEAARQLGQRRVGRLPVVENGRLVGILSASDVARELRQALDGLLAEGEKATTDATAGEPIGEKAYAPRGGVA
ncbi:MAG TPA: CBS domain-containing protein [Chloroflexota bacterium]